MRGVNVRTVILTVVALCMLLPGLALAQTGKIVGVVKDAETGQPIIGANVVVEGSSRGAATGLDGDFVILAMQPGTYNVHATSVGYGGVVMSDVVISIDLTTTLEFQLQPSAVELTTVTLVYKKPTVELGVSSKVERISSDQLAMMPSDDVASALSSTPGFKIDEEGKIHIRGGRETESRFLVGGIDTRDPITGETLPLNLSSINIGEIQILTGGMSAEYGQAMSGFVTISAPEGQTKSYNGTVLWETDQLSDKYSFNEDKINGAFGGPLPFSKSMFGNPITFYATVNTKFSDTSTPLDVDYDNQDWVGMGANLPRRQYNDVSGSVNFALDMGKGKKITAYFTERTLEWDIYGRSASGVSGNYGWQYKYNLDNIPIARERHSSFDVKFTNQASDKTVLTMSFGRRVINGSVQPRGKNPGEFTLETEIEGENFNRIVGVNDLNGNGVWDQDADGDGVIHSGIDELGNDQDSNNFLDSYFDADRSGDYEGGNEGYEDLNLNGRWDRGEDWIDLNGNGVYDYAEPWTDRVDPETGANNAGLWDPWDPYVDINNNGRWDPSEPQTPEQDANGNGRWDGERFQDADGDGTFDRWETFVDKNNNGRWDSDEVFEDLNNNGVQDDGEGYDDQNMNGDFDGRELVDNHSSEDLNEPYLDGDFFNDTGEPFIDERDSRTGQYNGVWDMGEIFWDLPTSGFGAGGIIITGDGSIVNAGFPTLNGVYDGPNGFFDEFELFTFKTNDPSQPVGYTWDLDEHGSDWVYTQYLMYTNDKSTWVNRTLHDVNPANPADKTWWGFNAPNFMYDEGMESYVDLNGNNEWNRYDHFLNPGTYDQSAVWTLRHTEEYTFKASWQSQIHKFHEFKAGTEVKYTEMSRKHIESPDQLYTGAGNVGENEPWQDRGSNRDFWNYKPISGAVYFKDKMEFEGLIVDAGVRGEFVVHDKNVIDIQNERFRNNEPGATKVDRTRFQLAPRLGISHPITSQSKLYFNYGHIYQLPSYDRFYQSTTTNVNEGIIGNPNLKYERTVTYEIGVHTQISDNLSIQVAGYYRDLYDMISTLRTVDQGITIYQFVNLDYGRTRGLELKLDRSFADHYQFTFNYDFSYAYGKASGVADDFNNRGSNAPTNYDEHPLDWDETHIIGCNAAISYQKDDYPVLFGIRLPDYWLLSMQWSFGSGQPYTPSQWSTGINANIILDNSARKPWTETTSLRFEKYFDMGDIRWIAGFQVFNLFDKSNINSIYAETGTADVAIHPLDISDYIPGDNRAEYDANPRNYGSGRQMFLKVGMEF